VSEVHLGVTEIIGRYLLILWIAIIAMWFGYMLSMAIMNNICGCMRTGPADFWNWLDIQIPMILSKKEGA